MNDTWTIVAMGAGVFALRLGGLALPPGWLPSPLTRGLAFVPIAVLSALVVTSLTGTAEDGALRLAAVVGAALVAWRTGRMWACIATGIGLWWVQGLVW